MNPILDVRGLGMRFGMVTAAEGVNVTVHAGEMVGIIGPNGAGKTTFLNLVTGYLKPQSGRVQVLGRNIDGLGPREVTALGVARSFQVPQLFLTLTAVENVLVALATAGGASQQAWRPLRQVERLAAARALLDQFDLGAMADRTASELPAGARKLLDVALALALGPRLLLMDEPTSGVSVDDKFGIMDTLTQVLRRHQVTAMFVEHDMEVVRRYAMRVLVLNQGQIVVDGKPEDVLSDAEIRSTVAGWG